MIERADGDTNARLIKFSRSDDGALARLDLMKQHLAL
jgi:hypothetical protein